MTAFRRVASGNVAGLASMAATLAVQLVLVPLFLGVWSPALWATWIALTTAVALVQIPAVAHLDYIGYEAMKLPPGRPVERSAIVADAVPPLLLAGAATTALLAAFLWSPLAPRVFAVAPGSDALRVVRWTMLAANLIWTVQLPVHALGRALASLGRYALTVWYALALSLAQALLPVAAALAGAGLSGAAVAFVVANLLVNAVTAVHFLRAARREGLVRRRPRWREGWRDMRRGYALALSSVLEYLQQAGFRLILLPLVGPLGLARFATLRTVANTVQQGLGVLVNPALPELMRYVSVRDERRLRLMMHAMLYIAVVALCPGLVVLQLLVRPLYAVWTQGKLAFDAPVFVLLSLSILLTAVAQPARAVLRGNNLVGVQVAIAALGGGVLVAVTLAAVPWLGLAGAALGVVACEGARGGAFLLVASRWFRASGYTYPWRTTAAALAAVVATVAATAGIAAAPALALPVAIGYGTGWMVLNLVFWRALPAHERLMVRDVLRARRRSAAR